MIEITANNGLKEHTTLEGEFVLVYNPLTKKIIKKDSTSNEGVRTLTPQTNVMVVGTKEEIETEINENSLIEVI